MVIKESSSEFTNKFTNKIYLKNNRASHRCQMRIRIRATRLTLKAMASSSLPKTFFKNLSRKTRVFFKKWTHKSATTYNLWRDNSLMVEIRKVQALGKSRCWSCQVSHITTTDRTRSKVMITLVLQLLAHARIWRNHFSDWLLRQMLLMLDPRKFYKSLWNSYRRNGKSSKPTTDTSMSNSDPWDKTWLFKGFKTHFLWKFMKLMLGLLSRWLTLISSINAKLNFTIFTKWI